MEAAAFFLTECSDSTVSQTRLKVVLFGECGVGKSSIINAIVGRPVAKTSNDVQGCTDDNTSYGVTLDTGVAVDLWDTIGLDEGTAGRTPAEKAKRCLKLFLQRQIATPEGVDLLLYCIRGASGTKNLPVKRGHWEKYKFVFEEVCKTRIPVAMVVTHLESFDPRGNMDTWWNDNEAKILDFGFQLCAHACVTIVPPDTEDSAVNRADASRRKLHDLLSRSYLAPRNILLFGDREDKDDFIDMTIATGRAKNHKLEGISQITCTPVAFEAHTHVNLWNVCGFDEANEDALVTEKYLRLLVQAIRQTAGIDLLLFCFRAGRIRVRHTRSYNLFHAAICRKKVPVSMVVLGSGEDAGTWWPRNEQDLKRRGFRFDAHVYVPCDPSRRRPAGTGDLDDAARRRLIDVMQEEHTLGSWKIGDDAFWVTVPNVRAVVGEVFWPMTTVVVCDATRRGAFLEIARDVQSSLLRVVGLGRREHRFRQVDPQSLSSPSPSSGNALPRAYGGQSNKNKGINLIMFFMPAEGPDSETWRTLERFYGSHKGGITPLIVVVHGIPERRLAEDFWKTAPRHVRRRIGACLTYHPGSDACAEAREVAQGIMVDMIQHRCLVDLGQKVGMMQEILSIWRKYRSQRMRGSDGVVDVR